MHRKIRHMLFKELVLVSIAIEVSALMEVSFAKAVSTVSYTITSKRMHCDYMFMETLRSTQNW